MRWLLQFEGRATRPSIILVRMPPLKFGEKRKLEEFLGMGGGYVLGFSDRTFREFVHDNTGLDIDDPEVSGMGSKGRRLRHFWDNQPDYIVGKLLKDLIDSVDADPPEESQSFGEVRYGVRRSAAFKTECQKIAALRLPSRSAAMRRCSGSPIRRLEDCRVRKRLQAALEPY
jgi:hypothetical protein